MNENNPHIVKDEEDLVLQSGDYSQNMECNVSSIYFADHILETLNKRMGYGVIVKLLGQSIGYRDLKAKLQSI